MDVHGTIPLVGRATLYLNKGNGEGDEETAKEVQPGDELVLLAGQVLLEMCQTLEGEFSSPRKLFRILHYFV